MTRLLRLLSLMSKIGSWFSLFSPLTERENWNQSEFLVISWIFFKTPKNLLFIWVTHRPVAEICPISIICKYSSTTIQNPLFQLKIWRRERFFFSSPIFQLHPRNPLTFARTKKTIWVFRHRFILKNQWVEFCQKPKFKNAVW